MSNKVNTYLGLRILIFARLILRRKLSLLKLWNFLVCYSSYFLKSNNSGKSPIVVNFELWNECNESCVFCRNENDEIFDSNPFGSDLPIPKGKLKYETYINHKINVVVSRGSQVHHAPQTGLAQITPVIRASVTNITPTSAAEWAIASHVFSCTHLRLSTL